MNDLWKRASHNHVVCLNQWSCSLPMSGTFKSCQGLNHAARSTPSMCHTPKHLQSSRCHSARVVRDQRTSACKISTVIANMHLRFGGTRLTLKALAGGRNVRHNNPDVAKTPWLRVSVVVALKLRICRDRGVERNERELLCSHITHQA